MMILNIIINSIFVLGIAIYEIIEYKCKVIVHIDSYTLVNIFLILCIIIFNRYTYAFTLLLPIIYFFLASLDMKPAKAERQKLSFKFRIIRKISRLMFIIFCLAVFVIIIIAVVFLLHMFFHNHDMEIKEIIKSHEHLELVILALTLLNNMFLYARLTCHNIISNKFLQGIMLLSDDSNNRALLNHILK